MTPDISTIARELAKLLVDEVRAILAQQNGDKPDTMLPGEVAKLLQVSRTTVVGWIKNKQLTAADISAPAAKRRRYIIQRADLDNFLKSRTPEKKPGKTRKRRSVKDPDVIEFFP